MTLARIRASECRSAESRLCFSFSCWIWRDRAIAVDSSLSWRLRYLVRHRWLRLAFFCASRHVCERSVGVHCDSWDDVAWRRVFGSSWLVVAGNLPSCWISGALRGPILLFLLCRNRKSAPPLLIRGKSSIVAIPFLTGGVASVLLGALV